MTNKIFKNNINITVLVTSASQREITLQTVNYYSQICSEVIFIDEQKPYLSETEVNRLTLKGYIGSSAGRGHHAECFKGFKTYDKKF